LEKTGEEGQDGEGEIEDDAVLAEDEDGFAEVDRRGERVGMDEPTVWWAH
jgi:hypothetical protein